jgi:hypothetical protein
LGYFSINSTEIVHPLDPPVLDPFLVMTFDHFALWRQSEQCSLQLRGYLQDKITHLHRAIHLPEQERIEVLAGFVMHYVEQVPAQLKTLARALLQVDALINSEYFLQIACDFFTHGPELIERDGGWPTLLAEAYLAHRVVEEIYDRASIQGYFPAISKAMVHANVIVHGVLGESFANQLDLVVFHAAERLYPPHRKPALSLVQKSSAPLH